jgi:hypothetical protein
VADKWSIGGDWFLDMFLGTRSLSVLGIANNGVIALNADTQTDVLGDANCFYPYVLVTRNWVHLRVFGLIEQSLV